MGTYNIKRLSRELGIPNIEDLITAARQSARGRASISYRHHENQSLRYWGLVYRPGNLFKRGAPFRVKLTTSYEPVLSDRDFQFPGTNRHSKDHWIAFAKPAPWQPGSYEIQAAVFDGRYIPGELLKDKRLMRSMFALFKAAHSPNTAAEDTPPPDLTPYYAAIEQEIATAGQRWCAKRNLDDWRQADFTHLVPRLHVGAQNGFFKDMIRRMQENGERLEPRDILGEFNGISLLGILAERDELDLLFNPKDWLDRIDVLRSVVEDAPTQYKKKIPLTHIMALKSMRGQPKRHGPRPS